MSKQLLAAEAATPLTAEPVTDLITHVVGQIGDTSSVVIDAIKDESSEIGRFARLAVAATMIVSTVRSEGMLDLTDQGLLARRERGSSVAGKVVAGGLIAGGIYAAGVKFAGWPFPDMPDWPWGSYSNGEPEKVAAGVDQDSYYEEESVDISCKSIVSVAVGVEGRKDNGTWEVDGILDKLIFGDFLLCGPDGSIDSTKNVKIYRDDKTNEITGIDLIMPQLQPTHPRVDHLDPRNCVNADHDTSIEEANEMLEEREAKIAEGKDPKCDNGFKVDRSLLRPWESATDAGTTRVTELGNAAAQLAISLDADPNNSIAETVDKRQKDYEEVVINTIMGRHGVTREMINVIYPELTVQEILQQRLEENKEEIADRFESYEIIQDDNGMYLKVVGAGGEEVRVNFTGFVDIQDIEALNVVLEED